MNRLEIKADRRHRRKLRVRGAIFSKTGRLRLHVHRTLMHIYAQIIDDDGRVLASAASNDKELREQVGKTGGGNKKGAAIVGEAIAKRALAKGIGPVVFDRAGLRYHGRVKELAEAARKGGLKF